MFQFVYDKTKDEKLKAERGIGFEDVIAILAEGKWIDFLEHPNKQKYPHQYVFVVEKKAYVFVVPVVIKDKKLFLKTIYPSRVAKKNFRRKK